MALDLFDVIHSEENKDTPERAITRAEKWMILLPQSLDAYTSYIDGQGFPE